MIIKSLELDQFRNYHSLSMTFDSGTNILYGDNAQGKTNILEAIYLSATTKSHKGSKDRDIVHFGEEEAHIRTYIEKDGLENRVDMDLSIIKNGPAERRRFVDMELCQLDSFYLYNLNNYNKIVNQRNKLLKELSFNPGLKDTLSIWDSQLLSYGSKVIERRIFFVEQLNDIIYDITGRSGQRYSSQADKYRSS